MIYQPACLLYYMVEAINFCFLVFLSSIIYISKIEKREGKTKRKGVSILCDVCLPIWNVLRDLRNKERISFCFLAASSFWLSDSLKSQLNHLTLIGDSLHISGSAGPFTSTCFVNGQSDGRRDSFLGSKNIHKKKLLGSQTLTMLIALSFYTRKNQKKKKKILIFRGRWTRYLFQRLRRLLFSFFSFV
jgi:hypothetical protein